MSSLDVRAKLIAELAQRIMPLLAGNSPDVQGGALADLVAIHLAGHFVVDSPEETSALRERLLALHIATVRALIEPAAKMTDATEEPPDTAGE